MENLTFFDYEPAKTTRARFFVEIEPYLPIKEWLSIISPIYYADTKRREHPAKPPEIALRTYMI